MKDEQELKKLLIGLWKNGLGCIINKKHYYDINNKHPHS
jgi:hypothetical protein